MRDICYKNHIPNKFLGQNFLHDQDVICKIMHFIHPLKEDTCVEIGPGLGALTKPMCDILSNLILIELDKKLLNFLYNQDFFCKLVVFNMDVMYFNFKKLSLIKNKLLRIFGNIPYNISVPLILNLIYFHKYIIDINIMVQKEVAMRLLAKPGNKFYGRLSIIVQCYYDIKVGFEVLPCSFFPIPKVQSVFLQLIPKRVPLYPLNYMNDLRNITFLAFSKRRKILKNSLSNYFSASMLLNLNIDPNFRAENLSVREYCKIAYILNLYQKYLNS